LSECQLNWIGHHNRMNSKKSKSSISNNTQGSRLREQLKKTDDGIVYKHVLINGEIQIEKRGQKTELTGRRPSRRQRSASDSSAIEEEEEEEDVLQKLFRYTTFFLPSIRGYSKPVLDLPPFFWSKLSSY